MKSFFTLCLAFAAMAECVCGAVVASPTHRFHFVGTLESDFLDYPAGTEVGFDILGDATVYTGSPPSNIPNTLTRYQGFAGSFWIGMDFISLNWEIWIGNDWVDSAIPGPTTDFITFRAESAPGDYYFFALGIHDESASTLTSNRLPSFDEVGQFMGEISFNELGSLDDAYVAPSSISTVVIPEPALFTTLLVGVLALLASRHRPGPQDPARRGSTERFC